MKSQLKSRQVIYEYQQTNSKVYFEKEKVQNSQLNLGEDQNWRTDTTQHQDLL